MALTRKWVELALNQAEANDASFVVPEYRESQRNYAELCRHWLATERSQSEQQERAESAESANRDLQERNTALEIAAEWPEEKITSLQADLDTAQVNSDSQDKRIMQLQAELTATRESLHEWRRQFNKACEDANKAEAEVDRLNRAVESKNEALVATPCLCKSLPQSTTTYIPQCKRCQAIAYTGTEPQEKP